MSRSLTGKRGSERFLRGKGVLLGEPRSVPAAVGSWLWLLGAVALAGADERRVPAQVSGGVGGGCGRSLSLSPQILTALLLSFSAKSGLVGLLMASCGIHC